MPPRLSLTCTALTGVTCADNPLTQHCLQRIRLREREALAGFCGMMFSRLATQMVHLQHVLGLSKDIEQPLGRRPADSDTSKVSVCGLPSSRTASWRPVFLRFEDGARPDL